MDMADFDHSSRAIDDLKAICKETPFVVMAYYYFDFNNQTQQDAKTMLRAMLRQLCAARPDIPDWLTTFGTSLKDHGASPSCKDLEKAIWTAAGGFDQVYLVVDALDECTTSGDKRLDLLKSLARLQESFPSNVHLLVTSRKESDIEAEFDGFGSAANVNRIDLLHHSTWKAVNDDISIYIQQKFKESGFNDVSDENKTLARKLLLEKADGMYATSPIF